MLWMVALQVASRILRLEERLSIPWRGSVNLGEEASRIVVDSETVKAQGAGSQVTGMLRNLQVPNNWELCLRK